MFILIILMLVDTIFGWVKAFKLKKWKSSSAKWGLVGKLCELILLFVIGLICKHYMDSTIIVDTSIIYFSVVEVGSIIENYCEINNNLPPFIVDIINRIKLNISKQLEEFFNNKKGE